jgi:hypothetical protein
MLSTCELLRRAFPLDVTKTVKGFTVKLLHSGGRRERDGISACGCLQDPSWRQQTFCLILTGYGSGREKGTCSGSGFHLGYGTTLSEIDARGNSANQALLGQHSLDLASMGCCHRINRNLVVT